ncbi:MAG: beta-ketoacyl synthase chain length factor [Pseudomonadota bacterium]|nr:beta-ketoacyl synthase chain length factor [Pseudomonadota bacterium]
MPALSFCVRAWASWIPGDGGELSEVAALPGSLRRRVTTIGRQALGTAWGLPGAEAARLVLSSRHGEFGRTLSLLESVAAKTELSPADFTLSVHNALIGLLSIAQMNRRGHTAIAAGRESLCFALMEAVACLAESPAEPVVLIHYDEPLPGPYATFGDPTETPIALALALAADGSGEKLQLSVEAGSAQGGPAASHAHNFLQFLKSGAAEVLSADVNRQWRWTRHART